MDGIFCYLFHVLGKYPSKWKQLPNKKHKIVLELTPVRESNETQVSL